MDFVKFFNRFLLLATILSLPGADIYSWNTNLVFPVSFSGTLRQEPDSVNSAVRVDTAGIIGPADTVSASQRGNEDSVSTEVLGQAESMSDLRQDESADIKSLKPDFLPEWHSMITNIPGDLARWYKSEFTKENIPYYLGITISTLGLIASDDATWKASDRIYKQSSFNKNMSEIFTEYGDGRTQFALAGVFAAYGLIDNNSRALRTASQIVEAVLVSGGVVQVLKHVTGRESPFISKLPGGNWRFFPNQIEYHKHVAEYDAYPSGHVTTSLATVIVIAENYPEHKWIRPAGYAFTALLGIGMANKGIHWYSDYPLAIALGYTFGKLIANPEVKSEPGPDAAAKKVSFNLGPYFNGISSGLNFSMHF